MDKKISIMEERLLRLFDIFYTNLSSSSWLSSPEEDSYFAPMKEYKTLGLVGDITAEAPPNNAMPSGLVHDVKLSLDYFCDVVQNPLLLKCVSAAVHGMLLHSFWHISEFDYGLISLLLVLMIHLLGVHPLVISVLWCFTHIYTYLNLL